MTKEATDPDCLFPSGHVSDPRLPWSTRIAIQRQIYLNRHCAAIGVCRSEDVKENDSRRT